MENKELELENWKEIAGFEGLYEVSNFGRVRSLVGRWERYKEPKILKAGKNKKGYLLVNLYKNGKRKHFTVHRLVANAFISNPLNLPEVNHRDEDKTNNHVYNLEFCDHKHNINYGTCIERRAEKRSKAIISTDEFGNEEYFSSMHEAERKGFDKGAIWNCCNGKRKTHGGRTWRYT